MQYINLKNRAISYAQLMRLDKPIGSLLLLWPTLWALWFANQGLPSAHLLAVFIGGVLLMRAAGCVINDFADRKIDPRVTRTKSRPLASGKVTSTEALILFALLCAAAFLLVLTTNRLTIYLSLLALALAVIYPFSKRFFALPQLFLGAAFSMAIPMAFAASLDAVPLLAWLLFTANLLWTVAYDTEYAITDREDDLKINIKSTAIFFGSADVAMTMALAAMFLLAMLFAAAAFEQAGFYYLALALAAVLFIYQYWLIKKRDPQQCFKAFLNNNYVGMLIFVGVSAQYWHNAQSL